MRTTSSHVELARTLVRRGDGSVDRAEHEQAVEAAKILWTGGIRIQGICGDCGRGYIGPRCRCRAGARSSHPAVPSALPQLRWHDDPDALVAVRTGALIRMRSEADEVNGTTETGGFLFALRQGDPTEIVAAPPAGTDLRFDSGTLSIDTLDEFDRKLDEPKGDFLRIGHWHTHPLRESAPSDPDDLDSFRIGFEGLEAEI